MKQFDSPTVLEKQNPVETNIKLLDEKSMQEKTNIKLFDESMLDCCRVQVILINRSYCIFRLQHFRHQLVGRVSTKTRPLFFGLFDRRFARSLSASPSVQRLPQQSDPSSHRSVHSQSCHETPKVLIQSGFDF